MRKLAILLFGLTLLATGPVLAAAAPEKPAKPKEDPEAAAVKRHVTKADDGFFTVRYGPYIVKSEIDPQFTAEAAVYMTKFYLAFRNFFKPDPKLHVTPTVLFYKDAQSYIKNGGPAGTGGCYAGGDKTSKLLVYQVRPGSGFAGFETSVIRHEGAHQLLAYILGTHAIPIWYTEGVATFFESWDIAKPIQANLEDLKTTHTRFESIARTYGTKDFLSLHKLTDLSYETWTKDDVLLHYAEVQSFMTFLITTEKGRQFFAAIFRLIAAKKDVDAALPWDVVENAQKAWYKDIEARIEKAKEPPEPAEKKPAKKTGK